ncbi:Serine/threonine protein kinase [Pseudidiomarina maritima]|uniref:Serine/threonine protein kinase n=1 Tax=Pseudidiomarina maritima TaxID=519453 RepID=A0A1I6H871_9GAMM|nr:protein kinase [Pseudidiomarina maritima]SFR50632.1 Serine/threonine protein kinase [Pseudidiomarina maritima]
MIETDDMPEEVARCIEDLTEHFDEFERNDRGANGFLIFAKNKVSGQDVAIKFYEGNEGERKHDEPRQLSALTCNNILPILEARSISNEWAFFVTPRCFEGDLDDIIETKPSVHKAIDLAIGICAGVTSIHAAGMLHRDLKPGNIVILEGVPKIADFGSVIALEQGKQEVVASRHSVLWRPPESVEFDRYSKKGDVYQVGVVLYQLLGGLLSYDGMTYLNAKEKKAYDAIQNFSDQSIFVDAVIKRRIKTGRLLNFQSLPGWIDQKSLRLLKEICHYDPNRRPNSLADVAASLTSIRARVKNWYWDGNIATLQQNKTTIELRPSRNEEEFSAYKNSGNGFRKIPKIGNNTLSNLVSQV